MSRPSPSTSPAGRSDRGSPTHRLRLEREQEQEQERERERELEQELEQEQERELEREQERELEQEQERELEQERVSHRLHGERLPTCACASSRRNRRDEPSSMDGRGALTEADA